MTDLGRGPGGDRESDTLRFQIMELAANLLALLSILGTVLVIVLAADAGPVVIAASATAVSVAFRAWLAYRQRHPRAPGPVSGAGGPISLPGPRRSLDEAADATSSPPPEDAPDVE